MTVLLSKWVATVLSIAVFVLEASAQDLAFTAPTLSSGSGLTSFTRGQQVTIQWTTPYDDTTLSVLQDQGNGQYDSVNLLAASYPQSETSFTWTAGPVSSSGSLAGNYHFFLNNANDPNCTGCFTNSAEFNVKEEALSSSSSASSTSTAAVIGQSSQSSANPQSSHSSAATSSTPTQTANSSPAASGSSTNSPSSSQATAAGAASTGSASQSKEKSGTNLGIPLGVGLGAGIPVVLVIIGLFLLWLFRRRKNQRDASERALEKQTSDSSPNTSGPSTWSQEAQMKQANRESGALGPWAYEDYREGIDEHPWVRQQQQYQTPQRKRQSPQKYSHMPFRPSMATTAEESEDPPRTAESGRSWIEPFDFQQALAREESDEDVSQFQRGVQDAPGEDPDGSQYSEHSDRSVGGLPEVPQAVHHTYPDNSWPLRDRL